MNASPNRVAASNRSIRAPNELHLIILSRDNQYAVKYRKKHH